MSDSVIPRKKAIFQRNIFLSTNVGDLRELKYATVLTREVTAILHS